MGNVQDAELYRFSADDVVRMAELGILGDDDRVELVDGEILIVSPQGPEHRSLKDELHRRLGEAYHGKDVHLLNQGPLRAGVRGLPEPDVAVVRGKERDFLTRHPSASDTVLVVEIAMTSQERDRNKAMDYARGGAPVYWLLDLVLRRLDVYTDPDPAAGRYGRLESLDDKADVELPELAMRWTVASLLP